MAIPTNKIIPPIVPNNLHTGKAISAPITPPAILFLPNSYASSKNAEEGTAIDKFPLFISTIIITDAIHTKNIT